MLIKQLILLADRLDSLNLKNEANYIDELIKKFADDDTTEEPSEKIMYIMRGLPGSGKSTLARELAGPNGVIYSTDDFFMENNEYKFDPKKIVENHRKNQARAKAACEAGISPIVIDNTNTQKWEARVYVQYAKENGYTVKFVEANSPWSKNVDELAKRNLHGVPREGIENMLKRYEPHEEFTEENVLKSKAPWEKKADFSTIVKVAANCPECKTPGAYIGMNDVECQNVNCRHFEPSLEALVKDNYWAKKYPLKDGTVYVLRFSFASGGQAEKVYSTLEAAIAEAMRVRSIPNYRTPEYISDQNGNVLMDKQKIESEYTGNLASLLPPRGSITDVLNVVSKKYNLNSDPLDSRDLRKKQ